MESSAPLELLVKVLFLDPYQRKDEKDRKNKEAVAG